MDISPHTIRKYIDLLEQAFMLSVLLPYTKNTKKHLVKSPKVYLRDSGILHALLGIENQQELFGHPVYGASPVDSAYPIAEHVNVVSLPAFIESMAS